MQSKNIPVIIMLLAGSVTSIITYWLHYPLETMLWVLLAVLLVFYGIGSLIQKLLDRFEEENAPKEEEMPEDGAVIEKEMTPEEMEEMEEINTPEEKAGES